MFKFEEDEYWSQPSTSTTFCFEEEEIFEEHSDMGGPQIYSFGYDPITCHAFNKDRTSMLIKLLDDVIIPKIFNKKVNCQNLGSYRTV